MLVRITDPKAVYPIYQVCINLDLLESGCRTLYDAKTFAASTMFGADTSEVDSGVVVEFIADFRIEVRENGVWRKADD